MVLTRKEAPTGNAPIGPIPHKAVTNRFLPTGKNKTSEAPRVIFDPTLGEDGVETPLPNDSFKASNSPPPETGKQTIVIQCIKHYHQWLRTAIPLKTKLGQISSDNIRIQGPSKRSSSGRLHPVSAVKERY